ncbi:MAG: uridine kinase [Christensenellaceae bacterium]|nr:uridine kinase [Christensenellaceae bacterium]
MKNGSTFNLLSYINEKLDGRNSPLLIAIDGRCASGKTTLASHLHRMFPDSIVFHMDDFFLPPSMRTEERLNAPGGNVHYERFSEEILKQLPNNAPFSYNKYSCITDSFTAVQAYPATLNIIEGAYSMHPSLVDFYDIKIFLDISPSLQQSRLIRREGEDGFIVFKDIWIPLEEKYISHYKIDKKADFVLSAHA